MDCISDKIPLLIQEYNDSMKSPVFNGLSQSKDNQLKRPTKLDSNFKCPPILLFQICHNNHAGQFLVSTENELSTFFLNLMLK